MSMPWKILSLLLVIAISAITVVYLRHQNRLAFITFQLEEKRADQLDSEWGRLLLEKATWSVEHNIAQEARKLDMLTPQTDQIVTISLNEAAQ